MTAASSVMSVMTCSTAAAVADLLRLFFPTAQRVLDATYGSGAFWKGADAWAGEVVGLDRDPRRAKDLVGDFTGLPFADGAFDVVTFDPPHLSDAGVASVMRARYGASRTHADLEATVRAGLRECRRGARLGVLAKVAN